MSVLLNDDENEYEFDVILKTDSEGEEAEEVEPVEQVEEVEEEEGGIEAKPERKTKAVKPKRKMTEKQLKALAAGRAKRDAGRSERKSVKDAKLAVRKTNLEKRTIQKAIALKKREALEEAALMLSDEDSVDELEVKQVKRLVAKRKARAKAKTKAPPRKQAVEEDYSPERPQRAAPQRQLKEKPQETPQYVFY